MIRRWRTVVGGVAVGAMALVALVACAGTGGSAGSGGAGASPGVGPSASSSAVPGASGGGVSGPRNGVDDATLALAAGAGRITVRTASLGSTLYRVDAAGGTMPDVSFQGSTLRVRSPSGSHRAPERITVTLSQDVGWTLDLNGGSTQEVVDVRSGRVRSVSMAAGANRMELDLGAPRGAVPVRFTGGANQVALRIPSGASASLHIVGSANSVTVDGESKGSIAGGATFQVGSGGGDRYRFDLTAGLNTLTLTQG